ncbi:hypothetical protein H6P81_003392 [Aristolochia fimbriata]|uniref:Aminotransferase-like plant mobile domain-containing protein n=1 Tax=Aristolochia fimbriata TaxID=158543 RepID=A0AAV7FE63_ARIFI|nr:hypothetical protein H6P81_003392 [Aristolochia fimbriata]
MPLQSSGAIHYDFYQLTSEYYYASTIAGCMNEAFDVPTRRSTWVRRSSGTPTRSEEDYGRPMSTRIHNSMDWRDDDRGRYLCSNCKQPGHNKRACKAPSSDNAKSSRAGSGRRTLDAWSALSISRLYDIGPWTSRMLPHVEAAGVWCTTRVQVVETDTLDYALVERWRSETNTFHLANGEMTITLEDGLSYWDYALTETPWTGSTSGD